MRKKKPTPEQLRRAGRLTKGQIHELLFLVRVRHEFCRDGDAAHRRSYAAEIRRLERIQAKLAAQGVYS